jgi:hypothetical protein
METVTFVRDFESKEAVIKVETDNYETFIVYKEEYRKDFTTHPKIYVGSFSFTSEDIDGAINSEKKISDFIAEKFNFTNVWGLGCSPHITIKG